MSIHYSLLIVFVFFCLRPLRVCSEEHTLKDLSSSKQWLRLLHYKKNFFTGHTSEINLPSFFVSSVGFDHPTQELEATYKALMEGQKGKYGLMQTPAACTFRARYLWLKKYFKDIPKVDCPDFEEWQKGLGAKSATVVFSSAYPNNPASMFGHTLLRLNREDGKPILDYGANFEATVDPDDSPPVYAFKGLLGLYQGRFSLAPYYNKVNEYSYSEGRDLWEFDLNLNQEEVNFLVAHLWELYVNGEFTYYFLTKNCSYQILALLEATKEDWQLSDSFYLYALPIDTIKKIAKNPLNIRKTTLRPSLYTQMMKQINELEAKQKEERLKILEGQLDPAVCSDLKILESVLTTFDYWRRRDAQGLTPKLEAIFRKTLLQRAKLGGVTSKQETESDKEESPILSHDSSLLFLGGMLREKNYHHIVGGRLALHDLADYAKAYPRGLQVDVGRVKFSYYQKKGINRVRLEELTFFDLLSLDPAKASDLQLSWVLRAGGYRALDFGRDDAFVWGGEGGPGIAFDLYQKLHWLYFMIAARAEVGSELSKSWRYGPVGELGLVFSLGERVNFLSSARLMVDFNNSWDNKSFWTTQSTLAYSMSTNWQLRFFYRNSSGSLSNHSKIEEWEGQLRFYF